MTASIQHFLLVFDHSLDRLIDQQDFGTDVTAATAAYSAAETRYRDNSLIDIVLVGSDSIDTVRTTHSTYFDGKGRSMIDQLLERVLVEG